LGEIFNIFKNNIISIKVAKVARYYNCSYKGHGCHGFVSSVLNFAFCLLLGLKKGTDQTNQLT
jgi:hypothetical protein